MLTLLFIVDKYVWRKKFYSSRQSFISVLNLRLPAWQKVFRFPTSRHVRDIIQIVLS